MPPIASPWRRAAAWLIDATIGGLLALCFAAVAGGRGDASQLWHVMTFKSVDGRAGQQLSDALHPGTADPAALASLLRLLAILAVICLVGVAYRVTSTALWGAGLGKVALGLRVVAAQDPTSPPGWGRAWKRWAVPQAPGLIPLPATGLLAFAPAFKDRVHRGLHDRAAGTLVIDVRRLPTAPHRPRDTD